LPDIFTNAKANESLEQVNQTLTMFNSPDTNLSDVIIGIKLGPGGGVENMQDQVRWCCWCTAKGQSRVKEH
jgi:hypothetical protein